MVALQLDPLKISSRKRGGGAGKDAAPPAQCFLEVNQEFDGIFSAGGLLGGLLGGVKYIHNVDGKLLYCSGDQNCSRHCMAVGWSFAWSLIARFQVSYV